MNSLTPKDIELARRYIICRSAIKGFNQDKEKLRDLELSPVILKRIDEALIRANNELRELNKYPLRITGTEQPTVYEVKIGNRQGYMEINVVEITEGISDIFNK